MGARRVRPDTGVGRGVTDERLKEMIQEARPRFEARVASGEVVVRGALSYAKKGPCIRPAVPVTEAKG